MFPHRPNRKQAQGLEVLQVCVIPNRGMGGPWWEMKMPG